MWLILTISSRLGSVSKKVEKIEKSENVRIYGLKFITNSSNIVLQLLDSFSMYLEGKNAKNNKKRKLIKTSLIIITLCYHKNKTLNIELT